jgi:cobalamin synthase
VFGCGIPNHANDSEVVGNHPTAGFRLIHAVQRIADARTQRLGMLNLHTHHIRWACVLLLALLLQASIAAVHLDKPRPRALALVLATTSIVVIVGLVAISERPFSGAIMVSPLPLQQILQ